MKDDSVTKLLAELDGHVDALPAGINVKSITSGSIDARQAAAFIGLANSYQELRYAIRDCPLRQLAKWRDDGLCRTAEFCPDEGGRPTVVVEFWVLNTPGISGYVMGEGATTLEAAADAVRQLKERGEL